MLSPIFEKFVEKSPISVMARGCMCKTRPRFRPLGHGLGSQGKGAHVNSLIDTNINPISGGNGYNECKVRVEKA